MGRFNGEKVYAVYFSFSFGDEASKYKLQVTGYSENAGNDTLRWFWTPSYGCTSEQNKEYNHV